VTLTRAEADALAALMPLAATGPRAAKRFVNLYRLARARRSGEELRRFLGEDGEEPEFRALAFLLACSTGMDREAMAEVCRKIEWGLDEEDEPSFGQIFRPSGWPRSVGRIVDSRILGSIDWLHVVRKGALRMALPEATRYSFHGPGLDRASPPANPASDQTGSTA